MKKILNSTNMPAFAGMGARLKKPEKLQGINRSHLIEIPQHPNVPAGKSISLPSTLSWLLLSEKAHCKQLQWKVWIHYSRARPLMQ